MMHSLADRLKEVVGSKNVFLAGEIEPRYSLDIAGKFPCNPGYVVRARTSNEVAQILRIATETATPVTPLGGNTGFVGGASCRDGGIILSLELMSRILEIDEDALMLTVEAGATLQSVHEAAEAKGLLMPLDLGSRGTATVGGTISTNAGGLRVIRWGMMRDMVVGLEAVLADGTVVSRSTKALKDNAGYDWKQLMIGSEGTLGIVTKAILRLRPLPTTAQTAIIAFESVEQGSKILRCLQGDLGGQLSGFELLWNNFYKFAAQQASRGAPMADNYPIYAIVEGLGANAAYDGIIFEECLSALLEEGIALDVVIAQSERDRQDIWAMRDGLSLAGLGPFLGFDVSIPLLEMSRFAEKTTAEIKKKVPDAFIMHVGHAGDGNLHVNVSDKTFADPKVVHMVDTILYDEVGRLGGSISGEHGIGLEKLEFIGRSRSDGELALMATIKRALDPANILNPGKVVPNL